VFVESLLLDEAGEPAGAGYNANAPIQRRPGARKTGARKALASEKGPGKKKSPRLKG
jgi:hypothetical protein